MRSGGAAAAFSALAAERERAPASWLPVRSGHVCLSGRLSLSPAAHRGPPAVPRSALRAAPRGGPSAPLGPTSEGTFSRSSAPASLSFCHSAPPAASLGQRRASAGRAREAAAPSPSSVCVPCLSLPLSACRSPRLSLSQSLPEPASFGRPWVPRAQLPASARPCPPTRPAPPRSPGRVRSPPGLAAECGWHVAWQLLSRQTPASDPPHPGDGRGRAPAGAGPRPPGAAGVGRAGARAPARCARSAWWCHPSPGWSTPPAPGLETKRPSHERRVNIIHQRENWHVAPCPSTMRPRSRPARIPPRPGPEPQVPLLGASRLWRRTPGQAVLTPFLRGSLSRPTLQRISHNNNISLHPNPAEASALSDIRGFEQDPKSSCAAPTPRGRPPSPLPTRALIENHRGAPETPAG